MFIYMSADILRTCSFVIFLGIQYNSLNFLATCFFFPLLKDRNTHFIFDVITPTLVGA